MLAFTSLFFILSTFLVNHIALETLVSLVHLISPICALLMGFFLKAALYFQSLMETYCARMCCSNIKFSQVFALYCVLTQEVAWALLY